MSEAVLVEEPQANPYNANKPWDKSGDVPRGLLSPNNTLAYSDPSGEILDEEKTEATQNKKEEEVPKEEESTTYKKVDYKKRRDDLKRHHDKKMAEHKVEITQLKAQLDSKAPRSVPKTPEELATFKTEYPDVYDVVEAVAQQQAQEQLSKVESEIAKLKEKEIESAIREATFILEKLQPDLKKIVDSKEFHEWAEGQPKQIQEWIYDNPTDAILASRAIDLYKKDVNLPSGNKEVKKSKKKVADAAEAVIIKESVNPSANEKKIWTTSEIAALSVYQYEEVSKELDAAFKEGRIVQG